MYNFVVEDNHQTTKFPNYAGGGVILVENVKFEMYISHCKMWLHPSSIPLQEAVLSAAVVEQPRTFLSMLRKSSDQLHFSLVLTMTQCASATSPTALIDRGSPAIIGEYITSKILDFEVTNFILIINILFIAVFA